MSVMSLILHSKVSSYLVANSVAPHGMYVPSLKEHSTQVVHVLRTTETRLEMIYVVQRGVEVVNKTCTTCALSSF